MEQWSGPMEIMGISAMAIVDQNFWNGKRVLLTGHTGFKGGWLSLWLQSMGAELSGIALDPPTKPSLFFEANISAGMRSEIVDIRNEAKVRQLFLEIRPEIVIHMAAQPLVRLSYDEPVSTYATNVMGTVHVLEAARHTPSVRAVVNVTTDKCYENQEWEWGYRENEPMGGYDPYSNSKGCSELVTNAYRNSFFSRSGVGLASARAGNVIGGGDWALDRLVPDILRAIEKKSPVTIRNPIATRPWQHVLAPLSGYLILAQNLFVNSDKFSEGWNFGPADEDVKTVQWIVERMTSSWGDGATWVYDPGVHPHEANYLKLDISKARRQLNWEPRWSLNTALEKITEWHKAWLSNQDMRQLCLNQIKEYEAII